MTTSFEIADRFVDELCEVHPLLATALGVPGYDNEWGDLGMGGVEADRELMNRYRDLFARHVDDSDFNQSLAARVTLASIEERRAAYEAGEHYRDLSHLGCTFQQLRNVFDVMPAETEGHWNSIATRLETIDGAYAGYVERLAEGVAEGLVVARRQAESVADQADHLAGDGSSYDLLLEKAKATGHDTRRLERAVEQAKGEADDFAAWLRGEYVPRAAEDDAVGEERYSIAADRLVGMHVDPVEAYSWGWDEFHRLLGEMSETGDRIVPGGRFEEVKEHLENDTENMAHSTDELVAFVSDLLEGAVDDLAGTHFEVPEVIRPLTVQIAPPGGPLGVYYRPPSEDFSRPGGVWYAIGDQTEFPLYQHVSTAYHEGFPGHHLQIATARYREDTLSRAHRLLSWYPGFGEGWAMYAEVLMGELGYLEDPRFHFGMLAKQMYRAARIVVDIGLHLGRRIPDSSPIGAGDPWSFDTAVEFMRVYGFRTRDQAEAEVLRYLGWPGQAIAYKLGEREFLSIREEARSRLGAGFDLKEFHATVLDHGTMRLDLLRDIVWELLAGDEG
jgi:uncharacterized protein (DUF885 family)